MSATFKRINANFRHVSSNFRDVSLDQRASISVHLDLRSIQGITISEWQEHLEELKRMHLKFPQEWHLSYFVAMEDVEEP